MKRPQTASHMKGPSGSLLGDWSVGGDRKGQEMREPENRSGRGRGWTPKSLDFTQAEKCIADVGPTSQMSMLSL